MKIIYIMHIDWDWIKQRPHYLAEELSKKYDICVYAIHNYHRDKLSNNKKENIKVKEFYHIPGCQKNSIINLINDFCTRFYFGKEMRKFKPNYIWIGSPKLIDFIPKKYHDRIVYDCMDDYFAFSNNSSVLNREKKVAELAKLIFVSSESLQNKLINRYNADVNKIKIVRNAFNGKLIKKDEKTLQNGKFHICYIGTISEWFDFSLMKKISETFENVQFELIGPVDLKMKNPYVNEHIVYHGPIKHDELYSRIKDYDCLIMPFKVNEVVESVDPVKLYEYINFEKNIICVYYDEIKRFEPYVHFYHNQDEAIDIVKKLLIDNKCKYSLEDKKKFLIDNTWTSRCNEIFNYIENDDSR